VLQDYDMMENIHKLRESVLEAITGMKPTAPPRPRAPPPSSSSFLPPFSIMQDHHLSQDRLGTDVHQGQSPKKGRFVWF